jgi:hypothetical protein
MLDWLRSRPKPPVDTWYKAWTETRMLWLADQLGPERLSRAKVLRPVREDFPAVDATTDDGARRLMGYLCGVMEIDPHGLELEVLEGQQIPGAAGHYDARESGRKVIRIARWGLADFQGLVATLAHELAHEILLGRGLLTAEEEDHELVTDLLPVFLGLGIFSANSALREREEQYGNIHRWQIRKLGYLPSHVVGYALALFAHARGEGVPEWCGDLRLDAAESLRSGLRYLERTGDTLFDRTSIRSRPRELAPAALLDRLRNGSPSARLAALWQVRKDGPAGAEQIDAVLSLLGHSDEPLRNEAVWVVGEHALAPDRAPGLLTDALRSRERMTRASAAWALGKFPARAEELVSRLIPLLEDPDGATVINAATSLGLFGHQAEEAAGPMLEALTRALIQCESGVEQALASSLGRVTPDLHALLNDYFAELDPDVLPLAREAFGLPASPRPDPDPDEDPLWDEEIDGHLDI